MTLSRLCGANLIAHLGECVVLLSGMLGSGLSPIVAAYAQPLWLVMVAIALTGIAIGNLTPILFTLVGRQRAMP